MFRKGNSIQNAVISIQIARPRLLIFCLFDGLLIILLFVCSLFGQISQSSLPFQTLSALKLQVGKQQTSQVVQLKALAFNIRWYYLLLECFMKKRKSLLIKECRGQIFQIGVKRQIYEVISWMYEVWIHISNLGIVGRVQYLVWISQFERHLNWFWPTHPSIWIFTRNLNTIHKLYYTPAHTPKSECRWNCTIHTKYWTLPFKTYVPGYHAYLRHDCNNTLEAQTHK